MANCRNRFFVTRVRVDLFDHVDQIEESQILKIQRKEFLISDEIKYEKSSFLWNFNIFMD